MNHKSFAEHAATDGKAVLERKARGKAERPGVTRNGDHLTVTGEAGELADIPEMLRRRKLDPDDWIVERAVVNEWESAAVIAKQWVTTTIHQLKIYLKAKSAAVFLDQVVCQGSRYSADRGTPEKLETTLAVVLSDQQVRGPGEGYDPELHECILRWLEVNKPQRVILGGDLLDGQATSQWETSIEARAGANRELLAGHQLVCDYRAAVGPDCRIDYLRGNHEDHISREMHKKLPELADIRVAGGDGPPVLSIRNLLDLDHLGVIVDERPWPHGEIQLSKYLAAVHGWIVRKQSGQSAYATLDHFGYSTIICHVHRKGTAYQTKHEMGGKQRTNVAIENGTLARIAGGLDYTVKPDWQNGATAARIRPNGHFTYSDLIYVNHELLYEDQSYLYKRGKVTVAA